MTGIFRGNFIDAGSIEREFGEPERLLAGCEVLYASYVYENYEGTAWVVYVGPDGQLYEVHGSHCSCHGLEGQWSPEATSRAAIMMRPRMRGVPGCSCTSDDYDFLREGYAVEDMRALAAELERRGL